MRPAFPDPGHIRSLDGLRGVAIALVVLYHLWLFSWYTPTFAFAGFSYGPREILETGFIGVELFFFISGFCLFLPHARAMLEGAAVPTLAHFAGRRIAKIVPSYYLALAASLAFAAPQLIGDHTLGFAVWTHLAFASDLHVETLRDWNGVFWSLCIEAQFYVLFPLIAAAARRKPAPVFVALVCIALMYRSYAASCCAGDYIRTQQLPTYLDLFAAGMAAALATVTLRVRAPRLASRQALWTAVSIAGFGAFYLSIVSIAAALRADHGWVLWQETGQVRLALVWSAIAVGTAFSVKGWRRAVGNPLLGFLSTVSYNLYLWHVLVIMAMLKFNWPAQGHDPHANPHWQIPFVLIAAALSLAIATVVTYVFERPVLRYRRPLAARSPSNIEARISTG